jgi:hypothetical protein
LQTIVFVKSFALARSIWRVMEDAWAVMEQDSDLVKPESEKQERIPEDELDVVMVVVGITAVTAMGNCGWSNCEVE